MVAWLETIKNTFDGGLEIEWKTHALEQQKYREERGGQIWEDPDYPSRGIRALVASKAAKYQGEESFLKFHLAVFRAAHDRDQDIASGDLLEELGRQAGLDVNRLVTDMTKREIWQAVGKDHVESVEKYHVFGLPTLIFRQGEALFIKLEALPETQAEKHALFERICHIAENHPHLLELKRP